MYIYIKGNYHCWSANDDSVSAVGLYGSLAIMNSRFGEVAEWSNVPDSKSGVLSKVPRVRIPPSPPNNYATALKKILFAVVT